MWFLKSNEINVGMEIEAYFRSFSEDDTWSTFVPISVIYEFPNFFVCDVLKHRNPRGWGFSQPYRMTISKHAVDIGEVVLRFKRE